MSQCSLSKGYTGLATLTYEVEDGGEGIVFG